ncbi:P-loop containing nucleoside triphosphate hydrolase protein [Phycomyces blakesleeanus]
MSGRNIKIVCRFRPKNSIEINEDGVPIIDDEGTVLQMKGKEAQATYEFDKAFNMNTPHKEQLDYFIQDVFAGSTGTVFAYGQRGFGKTFTMMGIGIDNENRENIFTCIVEHIFDSIFRAPSNLEFTIKVSHTGIYMEKVCDLLDLTNDGLEIQEDKANGVYIKRLLHVYVGSFEDVYEVVRRGTDNRDKAYADMGVESSQAHSIIAITIIQRNLDTHGTKCGKLYFVDS